MLTFSDLARQRPALLTEPPIVGLSTDATPTVGEDGGELEVGATWLHEDTGQVRYWAGSEWKPVDFNQMNGLTLTLLFEIRDLLRGDDE